MMMMMIERENKEGYGMVGHFLTQCSTNFTSMGRLCGHLHKKKNLVHYKTVYVWYTAILLLLFLLKLSLLLPYQHFHNFIST